MRRPRGASSEAETIQALRAAIRGLSRQGKGLCWCRTSAAQFFDDGFPPSTEEQLNDCTSGEYCADVRVGLRASRPPFRKLLLLRDLLLRISASQAGYCFCESQEHTRECVAARAAIVMARPWVRIREAKEDEALGVRLDPKTGAYTTIHRRPGAKRSRVAK